MGQAITLGLPTTYTALAIGALSNGHPASLFMTPDTSPQLSSLLNSLIVMAGFATLALLLYRRIPPNDNRAGAVTFTSLAANYTALGLFILQHARNLAPMLLAGYMMFVFVLLPTDEE